MLTPTVAALFIGASMLFGGGTAAEPEAAPTPEQVVAAETEALLAEENLPEGVQVAPEDVARDPASANVAARAAHALSAEADLEGTALELKVKGDQAVLAGEVDSHYQRRLAEGVLKKVEGIAGVDAAKVVVLARTKGTTHTVKSGDTLGHIARRYYGASTMTTPIEKANNVDSKSLKVGQKLTIPAVD